MLDRRNATSSLPGAPPPGNYGAVGEVVLPDPPNDETNIFDYLDNNHLE